MILETVLMPSRVTWLVWKQGLKLSLMGTLISVPAGMETLDLEGKERLEILRLKKRLPMCPLSWRVAALLLAGRKLLLGKQGVLIQQRVKERSVIMVKRIKIRIMKERKRGAVETMEREREIEGQGKTKEPGDKIRKRNQKRNNKGKGGNRPRNKKQNKNKRGNRNSSKKGGRTRKNKNRAKKQKRNKNKGGNKKSSKKRKKDKEE